MIDEEFLWGEMDEQVETPLTRQMLDLKIPKPYVFPENTSEPRCLSSVPSKLVEVEKCPYTEHSIYLQSFINDTESCDKRRKNVKDLNLKSSLEHCGLKMISKEGEKPVCRPKKNKNPSQLYNMDDADAVDNLLKKAVVDNCLALGFETADESGLDILTDVLKTHLADLCHCLKLIVDNEALTGSTGFYDSIDQLLHDNGISGLQHINEFYKTRVVGLHSFVLNKALLKEKQQKNGIESSNMKSDDVYNPNNINSSNQGTHKFPSNQQAVHFRQPKRNHYQFINTFHHVSEPSPKKSKSEQDSYNY